MADAYVNFFAKLDPGGSPRVAQVYEGRASQPHRAAAAVGANAAEATAIALIDSTEYVEIGVTSGNVFACVLASAASEAERTAARIRIDSGGAISLARALGKPASLFLWAV